MSDFTGRQEPGSLAPVEPLTSKMADGKPYERSATVQAKIGRIMALHQSEWLRQAPDLPNEALVYIIRQVRSRDPRLYGLLLQILSKRIHRLACSRLRAFDKFTAQYIILQVESDVLKLVLAPKPSRKSEFLEIGFAGVVIKRTINAVRNHKRSPLGHRGDILPGATDEDGDEIERPIELIPDGQPGPEAMLLQDEEEAARAESIEKARRKVKDPRHFEAAMLHHGEEMPIVSSDPNKLDMRRRLGATEWQIKYRIKAGVKAIRKALGVQNDEE